MIMVAALGLGWVTQGCKKDKFDALTPNSDANQVTKAPKVEGGCLVFDNNEQFSYYLEKTSNMTYEERLEWENSIGFRSLSTIENQANDIEVERIDAFFAGQPDNLNGNEYVAMGLIYEPSDFYKEYVAKGVLVTSFDENGDRSTDLNVKNRSYIHLLNELGEVVVEGIRIKNDGNMTYLLDSKNNNVLHEYEVFMTSNGSEKNLAMGYWLTKGIGPNAGARDDWRYNNQIPSNADRRVRSWVYCYTGPFGNQTTNVVINGVATQITSYARMNVNHYIHSKAESKLFGNWAKRSTFQPITFINLQYDYEYMQVTPSATIGRYQSTPNGQPDYSSYNGLGASSSTYTIWQFNSSGTNEVNSTLKYNGMPWYNNQTSYIQGFLSALRLYHPWNYNEFGGFYQTTFSSGGFGVQTHQL